MRGKGVLGVMGPEESWGRRERKVDLPEEGEPRRRMSTSAGGLRGLLVVVVLVFVLALVLVKDGVVCGEYEGGAGEVAMSVRDIAFC